MDDDLRTRFGTARRPDRPVRHPRPDSASDSMIEAAGRMSAALEVIENARGHLYEFHRMSGMADLALQDAIRCLREAGHTELADELDDVLVGRDVVRDMWTFELVESYDEQYWQVFRAAGAKVNARLAGGRPHVYEAEMKRREQTHGTTG